MTQEEIDKLYDKPFLTMTEVGKVLGIQRQAVHKLIQRGTLRSYEVEDTDDIGTARTSYKIKSQDLVDYVLNRRRKLFEKLEQYRLPSKYA